MNIIMVNMNDFKWIEEQATYNDTVETYDELWEGYTHFFKERISNMAEPHVLYKLIYDYIKDKYKPHCDEHGFYELVIYGNINRRTNYNVASFPEYVEYVSLWTNINEWVRNKVHEQHKLLMG